MLVDLRCQAILYAALRPSSQIDESVAIREVMASSPSLASYVVHPGESVPINRQYEPRIAMSKNLTGLPRNLTCSRGTIPRSQLTTTKYCSSVTGLTTFGSNRALPIDLSASIPFLAQRYESQMLRAHNCDQGRPIPPDKRPRTCSGGGTCSRRHCPVGSLAYKHDLPNPLTILASLES
jgi:hypothetical protein